MTTKFRTGNGAPWLDLLATRVGRYRAEQVDAIDSPAMLRAWLREHGLEPSAAVTSDDVKRADLTREAIHRTATASLRGASPDPADVALLEHALDADQAIRVRLRRSGLLAIGRPATAQEALARLTRDAVQDLTGPQRERLHACGDDTCSGIFLDHTGRRRWCSDERCGNRMRVRAHRARAQQ
jgi:predicted RNA-binding Zn ribbon-like protein